MKRADRVVALVLLGASLYAWLAARSFSPLSALFPRVIVVVLGSLALLLFALSFVKPGKGKVFVLVEGNALPLALAVVLMVAWVALIGVLGFLVTSLVVFSTLTLLLEGRWTRTRPREPAADAGSGAGGAPARGSDSGTGRAPRAGVASGGVRRILVRLTLVWAITVAFYFFFDRVLLVSFPRGVLI